jgi:hypothetical protein
MADLASLKAQLEKLRKLRANGISSYTIKDRSMTYRSDRELASAIADLEAKITAQERGVVRKVRIRSGKGLT